jgi:predicted lipoprotein with Yx(FWY)xxD motif
MRVLRVVGGVVGLLVVCLVVAACGSSSSSSSSSSAPASSSGSSGSSSGGVAVSTAKGSDGTYLIGPSGRAVYLWMADTGDKSVCSGECAKAWPPVLAGSMPSAGSGVVASDLGLITRSDGKKQVTYKGHPLYYFVADTAKGETKGEGNNGFGAKWWLVAPSGSAITASGSSASASSGSGYGSGSGSGSSSSGSSSSSGGGGWG